jgi:glycine/sarcosine N-methyltransferase
LHDMLDGRGLVRAPVHEEKTAGEAGKGMNAFYESVAEWYDFIFPADPVQADFIRGRFKPAEGRILDIGCGTGSLAVALGREGYDATGVDLDAEMIRLARMKAEGLKGARFSEGNMLDLVRLFGPALFGCVACFGNTLVHLNTLEDVPVFMRQVHAVLKDGGRFLMQILNYDHVLDHGVRLLPLIENEKIRFERAYEPDESTGTLKFRTVLTVKNERRSIRNEVTLLPIRKKELEGILREAGFRDLEWFGDFSGNPLVETSLPLICAACKS